MSIPADLVPTKSVERGRGKEPLVLRGLNLEDVTAIIHANLPAVTAAVDHYRNATDAVFSRRSIDDFVLTVASMFPALAADVIARAGDDPAGAERVRRMGVGLQVTALVAVAELTLEDMGDLSDPSPALAALVRRATGAALAIPRTSSPGSTGPSVAP